MTFPPGPTNSARYEDSSPVPQPKSKMISPSFGQTFVWMKVSPSNFCTEIAACLYPSATMLLELESAILFPSPSITKRWFSIQEQYLMFRRWNTNAVLLLQCDIWQFYPFESYRQIMTVLTSRRTTNFTIQLIWPNYTLLIRGKKFDVTGYVYKEKAWLLEPLSRKHNLYCCT